MLIKKSTLKRTDLLMLGVYTSCEVGNKLLTQRDSYPQRSSKAVLQVGSYAHEQRFPAGNHGHPGSQVPHHMVCGHTHPRLLRIQCKILPDYLFARRHGNLDGPIDHGMDELLHCSLDRLPHTLLQLGVGLEQRDLEEG